MFPSLICRFPFLYLVGTWNRDTTTGFYDNDKEGESRKDSNNFFSALIPFYDCQRVAVADAIILIVMNLIEKELDVYLC